MKLEYIYSFDEYSAINRARRHQGRFAILRNWLFWGLVLANVAVSLGYIHAFIQGRASFSWLMFANLSIAMAIVAYRHVLQPLLLRRYYSQQMLDGKDIQLRVSENGIETITDNVAGQYGWRGFIGANEEAGHFIIWVNRMQAICIPKRAFSDLQQMDDFREIIIRNVDNQRFQT